MTLCAQMNMTMSDLKENILDECKRKIQYEEEIHKEADM